VRSVAAAVVIRKRSAESKHKEMPMTGELPDTPALTAPASAGWRNPAFLRAAVLVLCLAQLGFAVAGLIANPDFARGAAATSVSVLGVDFNGWHALAGLALFGPGLVAATRADWSFWYAILAMAVLVVTGVWGLLDRRPAAGLLFFPDNVGDAVFHFVSAALFAAILLLHGRGLRPEVDET
jgi:hypothetical protein